MLEYPTHRFCGRGTFSITNLTGVNGVCQLATWLDVGSLNGVLDTEKDAWATSVYPLGTCVELTSSPDVGDDKNTAAAKRARVQVRRTGSTAGALTVNVNLRNGLFFNPNGGSDLAGTYGTTGTADYYISSGSGTWSASSPYTNGTITIPAGTNMADVQIVTRADNLTEQNVVVVQLARSTSYSVGTSTNADILIFDGPLWTLVELGTGNGSYTNVVSEAFSINNKFNSVLPKAAGYGTYGYYSGTNWVQISNGGYWSADGFPFTTQEFMHYYGISTDPLIAVGPKGTKARVTRLSASDFDLTGLSANASAAYAVNPSSTVIVGYSQDGTPISRPVAWSGTNTTYSISDIASALNSAWNGFALAVNSVNQVSGKINVAYTSGFSGSVAFRTKSGAGVTPIAFNQANGIGDILYAPGTSGLNNRTSAAQSVNALGSTVGYYIDPISSKMFPVYWQSTTQGSDASPTDLGPWKAKLGSRIDSQGSALGVNGSGWIVGWSSTNSVPKRAVLRQLVSSSGSDWMDLNDSHFVTGNDSWELQSADAINDDGYIVGNGLIGGRQSAFVLVPRVSGN